MTCEHDYENPRRVSRASFVCPKCGADISMAVILIAAAEEEHKQETLDRMQKLQETILPALKRMQEPAT